MTRIGLKGLLVRSWEGTYKVSKIFLRNDKRFPPRRILSSKLVRAAILPRLSISSTSHPSSDTQSLTNNSPTLPITNNLPRYFPICFTLIHPRSLQLGSDLRHASVKLSSLDKVPLIYFASPINFINSVGDISIYSTTA